LKAALFLAKTFGVIKMKAALAILISLATQVGLCQHHVTLMGKIIDDSLRTTIPNAFVEIYTKDGKYSTVGTPQGEYVISIDLNSDTLIASVECHSDSNIPNRKQLFIPIHSDTSLIVDLSMPPAIVCHDSFLPSPIFFNRNSALPMDTGIIETLEHFFSINNNDFFKEVFAIKSGLTIYCVQGISEDTELAEERAKFIRHFTSANPMIKDKLTLTVVGKDNYFYCTHCDGCIEYYKYGRGILLDVKSIENNPALDSLRQVIEIKWNGNLKN